MASSSALHHHVCSHSGDSVPSADAKRRLVAPPSLRLATLAGARKRFANDSTKKLRLQTRACAVKDVLGYPEPATAQKHAEEGAAAAAMRIGIVGFGNFGQFIARGLQRQGHTVLATSRSDYSAYCRQHGIEFFGNVDEMCGQQPDVVLICSSILSTEGVLRSIPMHKLRPDTIFADVLSVKQFPRNLFLEVSPHSSVWQSSDLTTVFMERRSAIKLSYSESDVPACYL